jgi:hypothetical protein
MFVPQMITAVAASTTGVAGSHIAVLGHR